MASGQGKRVKKQVVYAFIDSQNLNLGVRDQGWRLDFARFRVYLHKKGKLLRLLVPNTVKYSTLLRPFAPNLIDFVSHLRAKLEWKTKKNERQSSKDRTLGTSSHRD